MIAQVRTIEIVDLRTEGTTAVFIASELSDVGSQPGAIGTTLIKYRDLSDHKLYDAAVGIGALGPMIEPFQLVAIPCPPVCGGQGQR